MIIGKLLCPISIISIWGTEREVKSKIYLIRNFLTIYSVINNLIKSDFFQAHFDKFGDLCILLVQ